jgi:hypothetical protein
MGLMLGMFGKMLSNCMYVIPFGDDQQIYFFSAKYRLFGDFPKRCDVGKQAPSMI